MKAITLRNLPPEVTKVIQKRAKEQRTSVNKAVIGLLEESVGARPAAKKKARYHDLDHLAGSWTKEEAEAFDKIIKSLRTIDPDLWK